MKKMRLLAIAVSVMVAVALGTMAFADAGLFDPVSVLSKLTGMTTEQIAAQRGTKTLGQLAADAGKLEAFKKEMLAAKKAVLDERVKSGQMTQAQADEIYKAMQERSASCDGTELGKGRGDGLGMGFGKGAGAGMGMGMGKGGKGGHGGMNGQGRGHGNGNGTGICTNPAVAPTTTVPATPLN